MKRVGWIAGWLLLFVVFCAFCACAQNTIRVASAFSRSSDAVSARCQAQADILWQTMQRYPHPANWHWIVVCDDAAWNRFLIHLDRATDNVYGLTDLDGQTTCLRGSTLLRPDNSQATPDHVIAHELAHIQLHTRDEDQAERLAHQWLRECSEVSAACSLFARSERR